MFFPYPRRRLYTQPRNRRFLTWVFIILAVIVILILSLVYAIVMHFHGNLRAQKEAYFREGKIKPNSILNVVHLDLKGAPPKMEYLIDLVPRFVSAGVTGLLIEYEDMFPYVGPLKNITTTKPYTRVEVSRFLQYCAEQNIEVIPLVQTFGHMEHVLKLNEFQWFRESKEDPRAVCPSYSRTPFLIEEMIRQVMALHKDSKRIHIGCDEVYALNQCPRCLKKRIGKPEMFFEHVEQTAKFIQEEFNFKVTPLIWDDMLRWITSEKLKKANLPYYVEIVIWDYTAKLEKQIRNRIWDKYAMFFKKIWVAGAYKGADGPKALLPTISIRHENHKSWMKFIKTRSPVDDNPNTASFVGFISTGWSRYDHFAPLCELLPASIPSLILNSLQASAVLGPYRDYLRDYNEIMKCRFNKIPSFSLRNQDIYNMTHVKYCDFPESDLVFNMWRMQQLQTLIEQLYEELYGKQGRLSEYQVKTNMIHLKNIDDQFDIKHFNGTNTQFFEVYAELSNEMGKYFNEITITEWFETHVQPYSEKLKFLKNIRDAATKMNVWPRRNP